MPKASPPSLFRRGLDWRVLACLMVTTFILSACTNSRPKEQTPIAAPQTRVTIEQGRLEGFIAPSGAHVWRNIPYAAPPTGALRWRAPRTATGWQGVRPALDHPNWCTQLSGSLDTLYGIKAGQVVGSEDCLYLNIYAPPADKAAQREAGKLPVMVWIHGGSNTWGRAEEYDPSILAARHNVVVAVPQYRVGPFGWLAHEALLEPAEAGGPKGHDNAASFALLDQIAALGWIKDNIHAFGGAPDNITLFGESAGAANIMALMASPLADGLFTKAIAQSGIPHSVSRSGAQKETSPTIDKLLKGQPATREAMQSLPAEDVIRAFANSENRMELPTVIADDLVLPEGDLSSLIAGSLAGKHIPFLFGSNRDESKFVYAFDPAFTRKQFWLFPEPRDKDIYDAITDHTNHMWRALGVDRLASALRQRGVDAFYTYRFDWDEEGQYMLSDFSHLLGAAHSIEIPFVFGTFDNYFGKVGKTIFNRDNELGRKQLSAAMMSYWAALAYSGSPGTGLDGSLPLWSVGQEGRNPQTLILDTANGGNIRLEAPFHTVSSVLQDILSDARLDHGGRCTIASELDKYFGKGVPRLAAFKTRVCSAP